MTITLRVTMVNRQMTPISHLIFDLYPLEYFIFTFREVQNSVQLLYFLSGL